MLILLLIGNTLNKCEARWRRGWKMMIVWVKSSLEIEERNTCYSIIAIAMSCLSCFYLREMESMEWNAFPFITHFHCYRTTATTTSSSSSGIYYRMNMWTLYTVRKTHFLFIWAVKDGMLLARTPHQHTNGSQLTDDWVRGRKKGSKSKERKGKVELLKLWEREWARQEKY